MRSLVVFLLTVLALVPPWAVRADSPGWRWPLADHIVIRHFDPPAEPWLAGHRGVDLAARPGQEIGAAGPGTITYAGPVGGTGVITVVHQGGLRTTYLPVSPSVRRGQVVEAGDVIGVVARGGHCPVTCLHWGLLRGDEYLDPLLLLGIGQVRLLPMWADGLSRPGVPL